MADSTNKEAAKKLRDKADAILGFPLSEVETQDGQTVIKPASWKLTDAGELYKQAAALEGQPDPEPVEAEPKKKQKPGHEAFINHYLICWNATEAARRAGYAHPNTQGPRLLVNASIKAAIAARLEEFKMSADEVLTRFTDIARGSIEEFLTFKDGTKLPCLDLAKAQQNGKLHLIKKLKYTKDGTIEIELYPADNALEKLGRANNVFKDTTTNLNLDLSQLTNEQLERLANGEDPVNVLASQGASGTRTP